MKLVLIGKHAHLIGNIWHVGQKPTKVISVIFDIKNFFKLHRIRCSYCAMALGNPSMAINGPMR